MRPNIGAISSGIKLGKKLTGAVAGAKSLTGGVPKFGLGAAFQKLEHIASQALTTVYNGVQGITVGDDTAGLTTPTQTSGLAPTDTGGGFASLGDAINMVKAVQSGNIGGAIGALSAAGGPNLNPVSDAVGDLTNSNGFNVLSEVTGVNLGGLPGAGNGGGASVTPTFSQPNYKGSSGAVNFFDAKESIEGVSVQDPARIMSSTESKARDLYRNRIGSNYKV